MRILCSILQQANRACCDHDRGKKKQHTIQNEILRHTMNAKQTKT